MIIEAKELVFQKRLHADVEYKQMWKFSTSLLLSSQNIKAPGFTLD